MADTTILNGDVGVTWLDNNRCKYLEWIGGTNNNYTMNELYSAMQTLQDESTTIDDGTCFFADTPLEYTIGIIDQGDNNPWYIQFDLMEHITAGALRTASWTRATGTNTGIICVPVDPGGTIVKADEGNDISGGTTGNGTLLEFIDTGGTWDYCIIRPDSSGAGDDFTTNNQTLTCNGHTATQWDNDNSTTGEQIWANIYSIGTIESSVHMYMYQGPAATTDAKERVFSWNDATKDWYGNGHIDTTIALKDIEQTTWSIIDNGYVTVYARKGGDFYSSFEVSNSITSGGRNPAPINTSIDADQSHGTKKISFTGAVSGGPFIDGEIIEDQTTGGRGILDLGNSTVTSGGELVYFPIAEDAVGGSIVAMGSGNSIVGQTSGASVTTDGAPANDGAADSTWFTNSGNPPTISFGFATADVDNDGTDEYYGVTIDCNQNPLTEVYQWLKYICQYGQITGGIIETALSGIEGQEYIGGTAYLTYSSITGDIAEGEAVTQGTAKGVVLSHDTTNKVVLLRSTRGSFVNGVAVVSADNSDQFDASGLVAGNFAANTSAPFGTLPGGGTFFGARGVLITDYLAADENKFALIDITGGTYQRPQSISLTITNLVGGAETSNEHDLVSMFRLTGSSGDIDKTEYNVTGTPAAGDATLAVAEAITDDTVTSGRLIIMVNPGLATAKEYAVRFSSWSGSTFTLANITGTADSGTTTTQIVDAGNFGSAKRGDLVYTSKGISYVKTVDDANTIQLTDPIPGLTTADTYELNAVPVALDSGDDVYVPFIHKYATSNAEAASIIFVSTIYYRVKVRNSRNSTTKIRPYSSDGNTTGGNVSVQVTRNTDTIIS